MEKSLFAQATQIRGKEKEDLQVSTFQFSPSEEEQKQLRGSLFALVEVGNLSGPEAATVANQLFAAFRSSFYQATGNNLLALEEAVKSFEMAAKDSNWQASLVVADLWGSVLYIGKSGEGRVILVRDGATKEISFSKVASGALQDKDTILLVSSQFGKTINLDTLAAGVKRDDLNETATALKVANKDLVGGSLCIRLSIQEPIEKPQPVLIADLDKEETPTRPGKESILNKIKFDSFAVVFARAKSKVGEYLPGVTKKSKRVWTISSEKAKKALDWLLEPWGPRTPGDIDNQARRKRKRAAEIAVVLVIILVFSIGVGVINHQWGKAKKEVQEGISFVEGNFQEAENLKDLNPTKAAKLVLEAQDRLGSLPRDNEKVKELGKKLEGLLALINKIYQSSPKEFADLTLLKGNLQAKNLKLEGNYIYILDGGTGSVFKIEKGGGEPQIIVSEEIGLQTIAVINQSLFLVTDSEIKRLDLNSKEKKQVVGSSSQWKSVVAAEGYRDNLYLLDSGAGQIWKYVPAGSVISGPQNYFPSARQGGSISFTIDGAIYLAAKEKIEKFSSGQPADFQVKNLPQAFSDIVAIYTTSTAQNLYVLDKGAGGVFVINKESGQYQALYRSDNLKEGKSLVVDEAGKKMFVLAHNTIYSLDLQ